MFSKLEVKLKRKVYQVVELGSHYTTPNSKIFNFLSMVHKRVFFPYIIKLNVNNKCNLNDCEYCYLKKDSSELETEKIFGIIDQALELGFRRIDILGGEPLLRKDILDMIKYAKKGLEVCLFTNASLITTDLARELKKTKLDLCIVGLDPLNNKFMLPKRIEGVKKLVKVGIKTKILTVMTSKNIDKLKGIRAFSENLGTKSYFIRYIPKSKNDPLFNMPPHKWQATLSWLINDKGKRYWKEIISPKIILQGGFCPGCISVVSINSKGDVNPCPFADYKLGNIYQESFKNIMLKIYKNKGFTGHPEECKECKLLKICGGGCKAISKIVYGDYLRKDPYCKGPYKDIDLNNLEAYLPHWDR